MTEPSLERIARQHAETVRLLGVDFLPSYRHPDDAPGAKAPVECEPAAEPLPVAPGHPDAGREEGEKEVKPARGGARVGLGIAPRDPLPREGAERLLVQLRELYEREAPHKAFVTAHTNIVFGEGDARARLMFIGEAPGEEEDRTGRPFVGRSGELLNKMIGAMGLAREQVYIANVLKTRPPNNATPTAREAELCWPFLAEQIAIISPEVIVTLGLPAAKLVLRTDQSMTRMRGRWASYTLPDGRTVPVMPTYHPAYLLRNYTPEARGQVWSDLQQVMDRLGLNNTAAMSGGG